MNMTILSIWCMLTVAVLPCMYDVDILTETITNSWYQTTSLPL